MLAYTIAPALESGVFESVIVSTDSEEIAAIARHYGAEVPFLRPAEFAGDTSPDIEWLEHTLGELRRRGRAWDCFSLLRPTSPFRTADDDPPRVGALHVAGGRRLAARGREVRAASGQDVGGARRPDVSAAAVRSGATQPWHSTPYQALPPVYVQNASLEIAWTRVVLERRTIAGDVLVPFLTEGYEGFDINDAYRLDGGRAAACRRRRCTLPAVGRSSRIAGS